MIIRYKIFKTQFDEKSFKGEKMKEKLIRFMRGRYGYDELSKVLLFSSVVFTVLSGIKGFALLSVLGTVTLVVVFWRVFSKDFHKCSAQNQKYLKIKNKFFGKYKGIFKNLKQRKDFHFYKCPSCGQKSRVPKGKGKITITCPKCNHKFSKVS